MRVRMKAVVLGLVLLGAACTQTTDNTTPVVTAASNTSTTAANTKGPNVVSYTHLTLPTIYSV